MSLNGVNTKVVRISSKKRAGLLNLEIEQGTLFDLPLTYKIDGEIVDLTGATVKSQFRPTYGSSELIFDLSTENGGISLEPEAGKITLVVLPSMTKDLEHFKGVWDLKIIKSDNDIIRLLQGEFSISREVTK